MGSLSTPIASNEVSSPPSDIQAILNDLVVKGKALSQGDSSVRKTMLADARSLMFALETPIEAVLRIAWAYPTLNVAVRTAIQLHVFEKLTEDGGSPKSSSELATATGADATLMGRILKHLAAMGVLHEVGPDKYASTPLGDALSVPIYRDGIPFCFDCAGLPFMKLPEYLAKIGYQNPKSAVDGAFQYGHKSPLHFFDWLKEHPDVFEAFNNHMAGYSKGRRSWMDPDFYPVEELLGKGMSTDKDAVLLVDVGGGLGHDIEEFQRKHPQLPGRLILQDQPEVIKQTTKINKSVEPMTHDFFTEQPIKGARAYYMHSCLHDWPDDRCQEILRGLIPAMTRGYSKILINENVIPDEGAHWLSTSLDWFMMAYMSSAERTEKQWRALMSSVGLKVVKIWSYEPGTESLIEVELA